ncbi:xanthine dehydrogenase family protein molybdopterin-binding subunit [Kibdelosporangium philippinense]|uniref:Xanthine dehydrogenase family protein molybdopterin-binding subunit n=1 Tax=Kibdelosporangium philippinense TaxID=211113 RepID=A0ABS8Z8G5_9PSEU|nr:xanthine dehydrogenase family protein molybdopterin-binding subunit [Kibdelosporangium philippinense]MCE7004185.1 xanthine dehydrogenase family protein molybdopterin-binding subunit [Kibdelosporangium philippinense]
MSQLVGQPIERVDGRAKVTGAAVYTADYQVPGALYGHLVMSTIARGRIVSIDTARALAAPGVVAVFTHVNMPKLVAQPPFPYVKGFYPLQDDRIHHNGQPIAYVVARSLEEAIEAANLVTAKYEEAQPKSSLSANMADAYLPPPSRNGENEFIRGDVKAGLDQADVQVELEFSSPTHHHNPIEPSSTIAQWSGDQLTLYETAQGLSFSRFAVSNAMGIPQANVRIISKYLGGGFGAKGTVWPHTLLTAAVARALGKPVKFTLTRAQMYTSHGHRAQFHQRVTLGAKRDGTLTALANISTQQVATTSEIVFNLSESSMFLYAVPNMHVRQQGVKLDIAAASFQRSPETTSHFGLETAMDELSYKLGIDPLELRLRNYSEVNPETGVRWSSKYLRECYDMASKRFGWSRRNPRPRSMRDGHELIGWGMATEGHTFNALLSGATVTMNQDGKVVAQCGTQEIGTGTYTVMTQVAASALGMDLGDVKFDLGDTNFPAAGISAASATVNSVTGSVSKAATSVRDAVIQLAVADPRSPLNGVAPTDIEVDHGVMYVKNRRYRNDTYRAVMRRHGQPVSNTATVPNERGYTTGCVFVEVRVDPRVGAVRVTRVVAAHDPGRVMNKKTAESQVIGGVTWGMGYALMEHTVYDPHTARVVNPTLSTYLIPVNADVPVIESMFVDRPDPGSSALGAKGFGETPITGVPAAIGNAVYHATGRRIRDLPISQDKLL